MAEARSVTGNRFYVRAVAEQPVWQIFPPGKRPAEKSGVDVALLVHRCPDFLNLFEKGLAPFRVVVPIAEYFGLSSPVLIAVQESGEIRIIGCPEQESVDAYTTLVADILALSAKVWRMGYEQFSNMIAELAGSALEELMLERSSASWDYEVFQPAITTFLQRGRFPVLIVTDTPQGDIQEVINYLNGMNISTGVVTYSLWQSGGILVIEPVSSVLTEVRTVSPVQPVQTPSPVYQPVVQSLVVEEVEEEKTAVQTAPVDEIVEPSQPQPDFDIPAGAMPTEPAKKVAKPLSPGSKPGVMAGKRPPPKPKNEGEGGE